VSEDWNWERNRRSAKCFVRIGNFRGDKRTANSIFPVHRVFDIISSRRPTLHVIGDRAFLGQHRRTSRRLLSLRLMRKPERRGHMICPRHMFWITARRSAAESCRILVPGFDIPIWVEVTRHVRRQKATARHKIIENAFWQCRRDSSNDINSAVRSLRVNTRTHRRAMHCGETGFRTAKSWVEV
jgi:hypothetical protein